jgi:hypothetical protein
LVLQPDQIGAGVAEVFEVIQVIPEEHDMKGEEYPE